MTPSGPDGAGPPCPDRPAPLASPATGRLPTLGFKETERAHPRVRSLVLVVSTLVLAGCIGSPRDTSSGDRDGGPAPGTSYFSHVTSCSSAGTCGTPLETAFEVPSGADRLAVSVVISSGASGAVRIEIKDPAGAVVYSKTLTPSSSQTSVESSEFAARAGRWTYTEAYVTFVGTATISVSEATS